MKIFDDFPALIWLARLDKLCDCFNRTWLEFTGRTIEQEFGNGWTESVHPDDFDFCLQTYVTSFDKRESFLMDYRMKNKFGEYKWIRDFGRPFYDLNNTFLGYIGSCYDITENKNNELKIIELNAMKDKFFSIIAHDLRNPFNYILGFADLLHKNHKAYDFEKTEEITKELYLSAKNTYTLLENLLEWSGTQSNSMIFKPQIFDLTQKHSTPGTSEETGTGLGLIISKEFVEKHNGKIWVESEVGKGSNFKFSIPNNKD